jgi:hypothetical protein
MPEAPMNKDDGPPGRKHNIRASGQSAYVQAVAKPRGVKASADKELGLRVLAPDPGHVEVALFRRERVDPARKVRP